MRGKLRVGNQVVGAADAAHGVASLADDRGNIVRVACFRGRLSVFRRFTARMLGGCFRLRPAAVDVVVIGHCAVLIGIGIAAIAAAPADMNAVAVDIHIPVGAVPLGFVFLLTALSQRVR